MALRIKKAAKKKTIKKKPAKKKLIKKVIKKRAVKGKVLRKKPAVKKPTQKNTRKPKEAGILIGTITHYFPHVQAAVVKLKASLDVGDTIKIKGHTTDFTETVNSIQMDRLPISQGKKARKSGFWLNQGPGSTI